MGDINNIAKYMVSLFFLVKKKCKLKKKENFGFDHITYKGIVRVHLHPQ